MRSGRCASASWPDRWRSRSCCWPRRRRRSQKITHQLPDAQRAPWPLYLAKEGGYYQKYGLDVDCSSACIPPASRC